MAVVVMALFECTETLMLELLQAMGTTPVPNMLQLCYLLDEYATFIFTWHQVFSHLSFRTFTSHVDQMCNRTVLARNEWTNKSVKEVTEKCKWILKNVWKKENRENRADTVYRDNIISGSKLCENDAEFEMTIHDMMPQFSFSLCRFLSKIPVAFVRAVCTKFIRFWALHHHFCYRHSRTIWSWKKQLTFIFLPAMWKFIAAFRPHLCKWQA